MDTVSFLMGKKQGGSPAVLEEKDVTVTTNGETTITPSSGYNGISKVNLTTNVPQPSGKINITENGTDIDVSSYASADVNVAGNKFGFLNVGAGYISLSNNTSSNLQPEVDNLVANVDLNTITKFGSMFYNCQNITSLDLSNITGSNVISANVMFQSCNNLQTLDLSSLTLTPGANIDSMFMYCTSLQRLDIRSLDLTDKIGNQVFGATSRNTWVPNDCLIIVKNNAQKQWFATNYSRMTNVKTVAELNE